MTTPNLAGQPGMDLKPLERCPVAAGLVSYSAVTWNPHRIHYDREYVRALGHPDVVVHGALQADWVVQWAQERFGPGSRVRWFRYRSPRPAHLGGVFRVGGSVREPSEDPNGADVEFSVWVRDELDAAVLEGELGVILGPDGAAADRDETRRPREAP